MFEGALGRLAHGSEGGNQDVIQGLAVREFFPKLGGARLQRLVGQGRDFRLERIDGIDAGLIGLDPPVIGGAEKFAGERAEHARFLSFSVRALSAMRVGPRLPITHRDASKRGPQALKH